MCQQVYLIAAVPLPLVAWNSTYPTFYVEEVSAADRRMLESVFEDSYFYYSIGSFMGCSCGLFCGSSFQESEPETYAQRLADSLAFNRYLLAEGKQHALWVFTTDWSVFPGVYPRADLSLSSSDATIFDLSELPEDVILTIIA